MLSWDMRGARPPEQNKHKVTKFSLRTCQSFVGRRVRGPNGVRIRGCSRRRRRLLGPRAEGDGGWGPPGGLLAHGPPLLRHGRTPGDGDADSIYLQCTKTDRQQEDLMAFEVWDSSYPRRNSANRLWIVDSISIFPLSWALFYCFHFPTVLYVVCVGCFQVAVWLQPISVTNQVGSVDCSLWLMADISVVLLTCQFWADRWFMVSGYITTNDQYLWRLCLSFGFHRKDELLIKIKCTSKIDIFHKLSFVSFSLH